MLGGIKRKFSKVTKLLLLLFYCIFKAQVTVNFNNFPDNQRTKSCAFYD